MHTIQKALIMNAPEGHLELLGEIPGDLESVWKVNSTSQTPGILSINSVQ